ncbi:hypothetical protein [Marinilabilia salmonicolor]|uniref:hypothetical protein n=1 Tax=Marinilabilia salmonicolor TaxID=989 RepID=UPI00029A8E00|nr:hypothetical protein [Marinilabilia salmonicolor]
MDTTTTYSNDSKTEQWFEELIASIKSDYLQLSTGIASQEKQRFYNHLMTEDSLELAKISRIQSARMIISELVTEFLSEIKNSPLKPIKLALKLSVSEILVWAVINDNDEETEDALLLAEARVNAKYYKMGFHVNTTVVENSDHFNTPPHYQPVIN